MTVARASGARCNASSTSSPYVCASGKSGKLTRIVLLSSRSNLTGYSIACPFSHALARRVLLQPKVLLDAVHKACAELFLLPVHRKDRHPLAAPHDQVSAVARFKRAALLPQPALEFLAGHKWMIQQNCCAQQICFSRETIGNIRAVSRLA